MSTYLENFKKHWEDLGKPEIHLTVNRHVDGQPSWMLVPKPTFNCEYATYRIENDKHWRLRDKWIKSGFTLPIEIKETGGSWQLVLGSLITFQQNLEYREAIETETDTDVNKPFNVCMPTPDNIIDVTLKQDPGQHYRYQYKGINLDPFRIADIYNMKSFTMMTILKKCLCAGNRGHKDYEQDLKDIINAAQRELEMIEEDK